MLERYFTCALTFKGKSTRQEAEEQRSYCIDITGGRYHTNDLFRRNIGDITLFNLSYYWLTLLVGAFHTKVGKQCMPSRLQENARRLNVSMHYLAFMGVLQ